MKQEEIQSEDITEFDIDEWADTLVEALETTVHESGADGDWCIV